MKTTPFVFFFLIFLAISACKNTPSDSKSETKTEEPAVQNESNNDSIVGLKGMEKPKINKIDEQVTEFIYAKYTVRTATSGSAAGETITVTPTEGGDPYLIPNGNAYNFIGLYRKYVFVDDGTGPSLRKLIVFDVEKRRPDHLAQVAQLDFVDAQGKLWYWKLVPAETIETLPDCPEKAEWEKQGFTIQYGKREMFLTSSGAVISKSEFKCFPIQ